MIGRMKTPTRSKKRPCRSSELIVNQIVVPARFPKLCRYDWKNEDTYKVKERPCRSSELIVNQIVVPARFSKPCR
jgi:hypothetical protein